MPMLTMPNVVVRDGSTVLLRQADERDVGSLLQFFTSLSPESLYHRFHGHPALTEGTIRTLIGLDAPARTLVAESGGRIVAFASYHPNPAAPDRAEMAFAVADAVQGHGIGTRLLTQLATMAREAGISTLEADVQGDNQQMLDVFRNSGFTETVRLDRGVFHVALALCVEESDRSAGPTGEA